jgi:hypothetical protein
MSVIPVISNGTSIGTSLIMPPPALSALTFTLSQLVGSMARAAAISKALPIVVNGLTLAFDGLLNSLVDTSHTDLTFLTDIEDLADNMRTAFSGFFGAGMADLYMNQLGYAFRCNGREMVARGTVFDFAYDGGPVGGSNIVAAEAKGTLAAGANLAAIQAKARNGYTNQVAPHLGLTVKGATIAHGYAICAGSQLKSTVCCEMHVEETMTATAAGSGTAAQSFPSSTVAGSGGGGTRFRQPNAHLTLRNYRDVFRLLGEGGILGVIEAGLRDDWQSARRAGPTQLDLVSWRGEDYVVARNAPVSQNARGPLFGLRREVAERILTGLSGCVRSGGIPNRFPTEIPVRAPDVARELRIADGGAEFPDGLAYFGFASRTYVGDGPTFYPEKGLS